MWEYNTIQDSDRQRMADVNYIIRQLQINRLRLVDGVGTFTWSWYSVPWNTHHVRFVVVAQPDLVNR